MYSFFISWMIISNLCHLLLYMGKDILSFTDSFKVWNIMTVLFLSWVVLWEPTTETMNWLASFIR